ncbi:hypothetical protein C2S53_006153 [Perilla frutescens var. hirtella]|uniref:Uncharacterized protein n=1 Tax=Perilla frutescens var. hirtella TaxID=608512 RepID=A0AAD4P0A0_PERFH|nr:hypothetical protein C2S53_006153 [Perilla frutescens var. hirtella]
MGSCLSMSMSTTISESANVVAVTGELRRFPLPITASQVIEAESLNLSPNSVFLCSSDRLYFDDFIPSLAPDDHLDAAQIYFLLPTSKLQYRLSASDMAALAVKASVALNHRRKKKARISPAALVAVEDPQSNHTVGVNYRKSSDRNKSSSPAAAAAVTRSGSLRKLSRYSSRRAMSAVKSFKMKLTTIYEDASALIQSST